MVDQAPCDAQKEHAAAHSTCAGPAVLIVGGSGYLGQHLIATLLPLALDNKVSHHRPLHAAREGVRLSHNAPPVSHLWLQLRLGYTYTSSPLPLPPQAQKIVWGRSLRLQDDQDTHARVLAEFKPDVLVLLAGETPSLLPLLGGISTLLYQYAPQDFEAFYQKHLFSKRSPPAGASFLASASLFLQPCRPPRAVRRTLRRRCG